MPHLLSAHCAAIDNLLSVAALGTSRSAIIQLSYSKFQLSHATSIKSIHSTVGRPASERARISSWLERFPRGFFFARVSEPTATRLRTWQRRKGSWD